MTVARSSIISRCAAASREFTEECVEFFAELMQLFGVPKSVGQIYGLLYASPVPLSFSDIVERLDISKGSASQGLQLLRSLGAINNVSESKLGIVTGRSENIEKEIQSEVRGAKRAMRSRRVADTSRREYFEAEVSLRKLVSGILRERLAPLAVTGSVHIDRLRLLAEQDCEMRDFLSARVVQLDTWRRRVSAIVPLLNIMLGPTTKP